VRRVPATLVALLSVGLAAGLLGACGGGGADVAAARSLIAPDARRAAPTVAGETLTGEPLDLASLRGSVVVLNVWGSWCPPCKKEQPDLVAAADDLADDGVRFVGIAVKDSVANAAAHNRRYQVPYPSLFDPGLRLVSRFRDLPPTAVPSTVIVDRQGRVAALLIGSTTREELVRLAGALAEEAA
jgi:thiol-disulfide isomerase/thioredoxin